MKKNIFFVLIALFAVVFASMTTYEQQTIVPELNVLLKDEPLKEFLSSFKIQYWHQTISVETRGYVYFVEFLIRKATHFFGYGIIGLIFYAFYKKLQLRFSPLLAIASVFVLGCIDEFHQTFTEGRTGLFVDVLIDTAGAIFLLTIMIFIQWLISKIKGGHRKKR